jgi:hypothetical protein
VACCNRPVGVSQRKRTPQEPAYSAGDKLPVVGIEYEMAFLFQDVEYFRSGLKLLFVAPLLGFSTTLAAFANISAVFIRYPLCQLPSSRSPVEGRSRKCLCDVTDVDWSPRHAFGSNAVG